MFKKIFICCILALLVSLSTAWGEEKETVELEEMVVTATRIPEKKELIPSVVVDVSKEDIERNVAYDLTDVLKKNSSVDVIQYPGGTGLSGISIRGFRPDFYGINRHSALLIDGRPAGATNLATIPMDNIEHIEVLKGPASSLYGSNAMGGVVNVITKKSKGKIKTALTIGGGSFDTWDVKVDTGGNITDRLDFNLNASTHNQNDDLRMGNGEKRAHTAFKKHHGAMRIGADFAEGWRLDVKGNWYAGRDMESPSAQHYGETRQALEDEDRYGGDGSRAT